jgi:uncharacterized protein DUF2726
MTTAPNATGQTPSAGGGCLTMAMRVLQRLFAAEPRPSAAVEGYKLRPSLLTPGGRALFMVLQGVVPEGHVVVPEVAFISLFDVTTKTERQAARNRIIQKRVDFVIYEQRTMKPVCAIELDDASHQQPARQSRDAFADELFRVVGLPLVHIRAASSYDTSEVALLLATALRSGTTP